MAKSYEKKYEIVNNSTKRNHVDVGGKRLNYSEQGAIYTSDAGLAKAIDEKHGRKGDDTAVVIETDNWIADPAGVHSYKFNMASLGNWKERIDWGHE